jgi:hypothetical protein
MVCGQSRGFELRKQKACRHPVKKKSNIKRNPLPQKLKDFLSHAQSAVLSLNNILCHADADRTTRKPSQDPKRIILFWTTQILISFNSNLSSHRGLAADHARAGDIGGGKAC